MNQKLYIIDIQGISYGTLHRFLVPCNGKGGKTDFSEKSTGEPKRAGGRETTNFWGDGGNEVFSF